MGGQGETASASRSRSRNRSSAGQFALLVENVVDYAIFLLDVDGVITTWNPGAERAKGYTADEAIGRHFSIFYTAADLARDHPAYELQVARREGRFEEEGWRLRKDGSRFWANVVITALRDASGEVIGFGKVTRDLTARREAEEALRAVQRQLAASNAELQRFATVAAHDLSEPLRTVAGFAGLLDHRHRDDLPPDARELLDHIAVSVERMQDLIDGLLRYARAGARRPSEAHPTKLAAAVAHVLADLGAAVGERDADVAVTIDADARVAAGAPDVEMVLRNLLSNALKFSDPSDPKVSVTGERGARGWRVTVADNGIGIAPDQQALVFGAFQRLHPQAEYPGTGLGLSICQRIVERWDGELGVVSSPGEGARFWFELPAA